MASSIVYFQRLVFPRPILQIIKRSPAKVVFDFDDAVHATPPWEDSPRETIITRLHAMFEIADHVVAGSDTLAKYARSNGATAITILPTALPRNTYSESSQSNMNSSGTLIGWIGYGENLRYLEERQEAIRSVLESNDMTELRIMTGGNIPTEPLIDRPDVSYVEWSREEEIEFLRACDIGIRPLPDTEWARAKGGYTSVVQFMALAKPVVVSPIGGLTDIVVDGETGFYATNDEQWVSHLNRLIKNESLRRRVGTSARKRIDELGMWTEDYAEGLIEVLSSVNSSR